MRNNFSRNGLKAAAVAAVTAALLVPLLVFGGPAFARSGSAASSEYQYSGSAQYQYKVQICHRTHSQKHPWVLITISSRAVPAHLRHGDVMPPCPTTSLSGKQHGHGNGHGHSSGGDQNQNGATPGNGGDHGGHGGHGKP